MSTRPGFYKYKMVVVFQLFIVLFTRVYIWFPAALRVLSHFKSQDDRAFLIGGAVLGLVMSLFNMILVLDALSAAAKWLPRPLPTTDAARENLLDTPSLLPDVALRSKHKLFKAATHGLIAISHLKKTSTTQKSPQRQKKTKKAD